MSFSCYKMEMMVSSRRLLLDFKDALCVKLLPGRQKKEHVDIILICGWHGGQEGGRGDRGTTGQATRKAIEVRVQGWMLQASPGAWHSWKGSTFHQSRFAVAELEQCY